mgnify:CR=1 FL=1
MFEVKRRKGESFEALMRRFQTRMRSSGKLLQAKKVRFYVPKPNRNKRRKNAVERKHRAGIYEYNLIVGNIKEGYY